MLKQLKAMFNLIQNSASAKYSNIASDEFQQKLKEKDVVILDVRTGAEFKSGSIPGAINANVMSDALTQKASVLDKNKTLLVYCKSGGRSASACSQLSKMGFEKVYNLSGGIMGYRGKLV